MQDKRWNEKRQPHKINIYQTKLLSVHLSFQFHGNFDPNVWCMLMATYEQRAMTYK